MNGVLELKIIDFCEYCFKETQVENLKLQTAELVKL